MFTNPIRDIIFCFSAIIPYLASGQNLSLGVTGDSINGFTVQVFNEGKLLVTSHEEFSIQLNNMDLSTEVNIPHWKGSKWNGDNIDILLEGKTFIKELDVNLSVTVHYQVLNAHSVKKEISLFQPSMPGIYYTLNQTMVPAEKPRQYVTFEHENFPGGLVHEMFPSAGFITSDGFIAGFLTDAGYKNQYTRNTRRRFTGRGGGFTGWRRLADPELLTIASAEERALGKEYIRFTFGEMYNLDAGGETVIACPDLFETRNASIRTENNSFSIIGNGEGSSGLEWYMPLKDQKVYTISFSGKGNTSASLKLFNIKNGRKTTELEYGLKYIDQYPLTDSDWTPFKGSIFLPYTGADSVSLFIGTQHGKNARMQIKDFQIVRNLPIRQPYNLLPLGQITKKTTYMFVDHWKSHQQFMISSQLNLAEAIGFKGTDIEKMMYANLNMLTWITDEKNFTPLNVPNMNYAPDMYNRDAFFSITSTYNRELNLSVWNQWGKTQTPEGGIGTIITPLMGSVEVKGNEATIEWLMWALLNKRRFGIVLPHEKIEKAVNYVLNEFDSARDGICRSHFPLCQIDIIEFNPKTDRLAVNQGMLAIALRTIKELGFDISESHIEKAEQEYRNFYDPERKHLLYDREFPDLISVTDLEPEFYSIWLFNRSILTDEMVTNHLNCIPILNKVAHSPNPEYGTTAPILIRLTKDKKGYAYLSKDYQPFGKFGAENYANGENDGYYYNGGSWLRGEYCAYVTGLRHGWDKAKPLMENRIWAEIYLNPKWSFSKEFIPTKWKTTDTWWPSSRGLCWNVFILMANEVAGLRSPEMDPDYKSIKK